MSNRVRNIILTIDGFLIIAAVIAALIVLYPRVPTTQPQAHATTQVDPYQAYLANNPDPSLVLSRDDAMARAYLGCGNQWAPGTVDAVLADAYRPTGLCGNQ